MKKTYARQVGRGWDTYQDKKCDKCGKSHPVQDNHFYGGSEEKMKKWGYQIITLKELDQMVNDCDPAMEGDEDEEEDEE